MSEKGSSQSTSSSSSKKFKDLIAFFSHPLVGILGSISGIIGIPLATYFYFASQHEPRLTYYVHPVRAPLVQTGKMSDFSVVFKGSLLLGDVTAAQIAIWNSGSAPIKSEDILSPVLIQTENNAPILEISILKASRPVTDISIDQSKIHSGIAGIHWRILEHDDGCIVQIIYLGSTSLKLSLSAEIVGQKYLEELKYVGKISTPEEQYYWLGRNVSFVTGWKILGWLLLGLCGVIPLIGVIQSCLPGAKHVPMGLKVYGFTASLFNIGMGIAILYSSRPEPPFGF
jgi:hypothetical protein